MDDEKMGFVDSWLQQQLTWSSAQFHKISVHLLKTPYCLF